MASSPRNFQNAKRRMFTLLMGLDVLVGTVLFIMFILPRSEPGNQWVLGLSATRFLAGMFFLLFLLANLGIFLLAAKDFGLWQAGPGRSAMGLLAQYQTPILVALYAVLTLTGAFLLLVIPPIIRPLAFLEPIAGRFGTLIGWIFLTTLLYIIMLRLLAAEALHNNPVVAQLDELLSLVGLFLVVFVLYAHIAALIGWINKTRYSYWNLLAGQFLQGKLFLERPPYTHDLTMYDGRWYVPMPPLPAILMMPLAYLIGAQNISTSYLSMVFSAVNGLLMFLILRQISARSWVDLSKGGIFLLVSIFLFGTPHLWVGISGRAWFVSQILTVTFLALAIYGALRSWSAWWIGTLIALAILARPNSLMTWPFVLAISMQLLKEDRGKASLKDALFWSLKTALPIVLAALGLLFYNYLRFDSILDFGYTTLNGNPDILRNAQTYGVFSPHFVLTNLKVMLFRLPRVNWGGQWPIAPSTVGMSVFLTTPPLLYLFRRYPKQWWILGAWVAVLFNIILLSLYHNTGADQFGYRYILDMLVPIVTLLALALEKRVPWHFIVLAVVSIGINIYGTNWFMNA